MLLAIDTATSLLSIALHDGNSLIAEHSLHTKNQHSTILAPLVQQMMERSRVRIADLSAVGVSIGPGSYTGLRIGLAFAKGIASRHKLPLVGVTTLDTLSSAHPGKSGYQLITVVQAGRGRIIANHYRWSKNRWVTDAEPSIMEWNELFANVEKQSYLTGEVNEAGRYALQAAREKGAPVILTSATNRLRRAGFLAEECWRRLDEEEIEHYNSTRLVPIYLSSKDSQ